MAEVFVCPTGAVDARSIRDLRKAGVVVVEASEPERCQFVRSSETVSSDDMLWAAISALHHTGDHNNRGIEQREVLAHRLFDLVHGAYRKRNPLSAKAS